MPFSPCLLYHTHSTADNLLGCYDVEFVSHDDESMYKRNDLYWDRNSDSVLNDSLTHGVDNNVPCIFKITDACIHNTCDTII